MSTICATSLLMVSLVVGGMRDARATDADAVWVRKELRAVLSLGPWPPPWAPDPGNRFSGNTLAEEIGRRLFVDMRISANSLMSCASCYDKDDLYIEEAPRPREQTAREHETNSRDTPSVVDARWGRWFGWGGTSDSLWAASLQPLLSDDEMDASAEHVAGVIRDDPLLFDAVRSLSATAKDEPSGSDQALLMTVAKSLAAFQETLVSGRTRFDAFRDALERGDADAMAAYPAGALRGLRIFVGRGRCIACHYGPRLTSGEFAGVGVGGFVGDGDPDGGRARGLEEYGRSPYWRDGPFSDDPGGPSAHLAAAARLEDGDDRRFKVPSLRGVAGTAPYMHDGSLATLEAVVRHYASIDTRSVPPREAGILGAIDLGPGDIDDVVAFLETLSPRATAGAGNSRK